MSGRPIQIPRYSLFKPATEAASRAKRGNRKQGTKPEVLLQEALWRAGLRHRKNVGILPGKPDLVFGRARVVVFCDGDFWHGRDGANLRERLKRSANPGYWLAKIARNRQRDVEQGDQLGERGWQVIRVWEGEVKKNLAAVALRIAEAVRNRLVAQRSKAGAPPARGLRGASR